MYHTAGMNKTNCWFDSVRNNTDKKNFQYPLVLEVLFISVYAPASALLSPHTLKHRYKALARPVVR